MPAALLPLITILVSAAGVGTSIYEGVQSSDQNAANQAAQKAQLAQEQQAQANQANLTKQEAVLGAQGQAQQQTGGSLTDPGTSALTDLLAGYPGYQSGTNTNASTSTVSGIGPSGVSGSGGSGTGGTPDIAGILAALRGGAGGSDSLSGGFGGGNLSGGNWQPPSSQPQPWQELSNPVLS